MEACQRWTAGIAKWTRCRWFGLYSISQFRITSFLLWLTNFLVYFSMKTIFFLSFSPHWEIFLSTDNSSTKSSTFFRKKLEERNSHIPFKALTIISVCWYKMLIKLPWTFCLGIRYHHNLAFTPAWDGSFCVLDSFKLSLRLDHGISVIQKKSISNLSLVKIKLFFYKSIFISYFYWLCTWYKPTRCKRSFGFFF